MELIAKLNPEDKINLQFVREDRDYFYNKLYQDISGKVLERIETDVKFAVGKEVGILLSSIIEKYMEKMVFNLHNTLSEALSRKLDAIIEQEKIRIKHVPFTIEYKYITKNSLSNETEAENYLKDMYVVSGYQCYRSKQIDYSIKIPHNEYVDALKDKFGIPDLVVWNDTEAFFVEVKLISGSVQGNQLEWYARHPEVKSIICFVGTDREIN